MKRLKKSLLLIIIVFILFFSFIPKVKGVLPNSINYTFENDNLGNSTNPEFSSGVNIRDSGAFNGTYFGTYSFTDEIDGTSGTDIDYFDTANSAPGIDLVVLSDHLEHSKVVIFLDVSETESSYGTNDFSIPKNRGTLELWILASDVDSQFTITVFDDTVAGIFFGIWNGFFFYFDGATHNIVSAEINTWYHIRIDFECAGLAYLGLAPDTFKVHINNTEYGPFPFWNNVPHLDKIGYSTEGSETSFVYIDAIGYTWESPYFIHLNRLQEQNLNGFMEVDLFTFDLETESSLYDIGTDNPSGWIDIENGFDHTNIALDNTDISGGSRTNNRVIQIEGIGSTHELTGIWKPFDVIDGILDITLNFNMSIVENNQAEFTITVYSNDGVGGGSKQVEIGLNFPNPSIFGGELTYLDSDDNPVILKDFASSKFGALQDITYLIYIDTTKNYVLFRYATLGSLGSDSGVFVFPLMDNTTSGLHRIEIISNSADDSGNDNIYNIRSVGVYNNSQSLSEDFGYIPLRLSDDTTFWLFQAHNLLRFNGLGKFSIFSASFTDWIFGGNMELISEFHTFNDTEHFINLFSIEFEHFPPTGIPDPILIFFIKENYFNISSYTVDGIKFFDDTPHDFGFASYQSGGVNNNESYFYVNEGSNVLRFTHLTNQNDVKEFIQIEFVIGGLNTNKTAIQFTTSKTNNAFGFFRVNYIDTSSIFEIPSFHKRTTSILPNDLSIISYILLITDNNDNTKSGITTGTLTSFKILYTEEILSEVITISLVAVLIPLIIILLPSLGFSIAVGKFTFVPFFLLMSITCVITTLIPFWLFFVIVLSLSLFMFKKNDKVDI